MSQLLLILMALGRCFAHAPAEWPSGDWTWDMVRAEVLQWIGSPLPTNDNPQADSDTRLGLFDSEHALAPVGLSLLLNRLRTEQIDIYPELAQELQSLKNHQELVQLNEYLAAVSSLALFSDDDQWLHICNWTEETYFQQLGTPTRIDIKPLSHERLAVANGYGCIRGRPSMLRVRKVVAWHPNRGFALFQIDFRLRITSALPIRERSAIESIRALDLQVNDGSMFLQTHDESMVGLRIDIDRDGTACLIESVNGIFQNHAPATRHPQFIGRCDFAEATPSTVMESKAMDTFIQ